MTEPDSTRQLVSRLFGKPASNTPAPPPTSHESDDESHEDEFRDFVRELFTRTD